MRNKIITLLVILSIFIMPSTASSTLTAKLANMSVTINGQALSTPVTINDTTYVKLRELMEKAGCTVDYVSGKVTVTSQQYIQDQAKYACAYIKAEKDGLNYFSEGSGVFVNENYILTCYHVIKGFDKFTILNDIRLTQSATLVKYDESLDVAILKVSYSPGIAKLGDSDSSKPQDKIFTTTSPKGVLNVISTGDMLGTELGYLKCDVMVYNGSSGGGLFNSKGELIGICKEAKGTTATYLHAVPINKIKPLLSGLK